MKLKQFFTDDDAVSPVIGVILMVAITVILAAVIASFVLGLGQSTGNTAPSASFNWDYDGSGTLTVTLQSSGSTLNSDSLTFTGDNGGSGTSLPATWTDRKGGGASDLTAGDSVDLSVSSGWDIDLVYQKPGSSDSSIISSNEDA